GEASRPRTPSNVAEYFGRLADTYGDGAYYGNRRSAVLDALAGEIANARDLLDAGCGNGAYLKKFVEARDIRTVTGIDLTFDMLQSARNRVGAKCRLLRANVSRLPFKPESFDFIFASHVLQFVADADLEDVVAEFARCLRRGGMLVATGRRGDSARQMMSAIVGAERWREYQEVIFRRAPRREADARPKDRFQNAFVKAGLRVEERAAPFTVTWADIDEWIRIRWMPLIPEGERERADTMLAELAKMGTSRSWAQHEPLILGRWDS
ncbi:MAG TPA: class I SAM-dependent methyltransferase, partial [Candidatus Binatus sp.]|uniref:class I SAM-dependent methyltransferase n=1 Tax=Candidatus Binatus sp. TaxID=2811406 RepID=UPI002F3E8468